MTWQQPLQRLRSQLLLAPLVLALVALAAGQVTVGLQAGVGLDLRFNVSRLRMTVGQRLVVLHPGPSAFPHGLVFTEASCSGSKCQACASAVSPLDCGPAPVCGSSLPATSGFPVANVPAGSGWVLSSCSYCNSLSSGHLGCVERERHLLLLLPCHGPLLARHVGRAGGPPSAQHVLSPAARRLPAGGGGVRLRCCVCIRPRMRAARRGVRRLDLPARRTVSMCSRPVLPAWPQ